MFGLALKVLESLIWRADGLGVIKGELTPLGCLGCLGVWSGGLEWYFSGE